MSLVQLSHKGTPYDSREIRSLTATDVVRVASGSVGLLAADNRIGRARLLGYYSPGTPEILLRTDADGDLKLGVGTKKIGSVGVVGSVDIRTIKSGSVGLKGGSVNIIGTVPVAFPINDYRYIVLPHGSVKTVWTPSPGSHFHLTGGIVSVPSSGEVTLYEGTCTMATLLFGEKKAVPIPIVEDLRLGLGTPLKAKYLADQGSPNAYVTAIGHEHA